MHWLLQCFEPFFSVCEIPFVTSICLIVDFRTKSNTLDVYDFEGGEEVGVGKEQVGKEKRTDIPE